MCIISLITKSITVRSIVLFYRAVVYNMFMAQDIGQSFSCLAFSVNPLTHRHYLHELHWIHDLPLQADVCPAPRPQDFKIS